MKNGQDFSRVELLEAIQQAEELAIYIEALEDSGEQMRLIYRWAELVDGVAKLMVQAEELLPREDLIELQSMVNKKDEMCWEKYRRNIRWLNKPAG